MHIKWLEDFLSLADRRSFSQAAEERHITQSAFSRRIQSLEEWLGVELVDRSVHPTSLTSAGWMFRGLAADILRQTYAARTLIKGKQSLDAEPELVHFAIAHTLVFNFFPGWLKTLTDQFGPLPARVLAVNVAEGVSKLVDGEVDMLIGYHHPLLPMVLDPVSYPHLVLGHDRLQPFCVPDANGQARYPLPGKPEAPLPLMGYAAGAFLGNVMEAILLGASQTAHLRPAFDNHMSEAIKAMVLAGHGVGWLPQSCVQHELHDGRLVSAGAPHWGTTMEIRLYSHAHTPNRCAERLWQALAGAAKVAAAGG
ncbi:LysR substrate-binding domain-containing protein [Aquabacterium sp.]|jgi:DNA-binding transcriptional LysR family regulator|uniref:LysR substrate-binding domain-containing protein n=1 Tax=Aquabacterium sp. TaxID=1872578 RepID=UPI0025B9261C|nr:LysR substrate-binding domain-containing protein [Aquabacterium sp.]